MPAISFNAIRLHNAENFQKSVDEDSIYAFIGHTQEWEDEYSPPLPVDSTQGILEAYDTILGYKKVKRTDIMSVVPRINWKSGTIYDQYDDRVNIIDDKNWISDQNTFYKFYVLTKEFNIYKCLSNNNGSVSTVQPTSETFAPFTTSDGYVWKYMYSIRVADVARFITPNWMPCYNPLYNDDSRQWLVQNRATPGTVDRIDVTDGGANYSKTSLPRVTIKGDGTGALATAIISDEGKVTGFIMNSYGSGYTYANVTISGSIGVGAKAIAVISPKFGHGSNAKAELGATYKMIVIPFEMGESGFLPTDVTYRSAGLIKNPQTLEPGIAIAVNDTRLFSRTEILKGASSRASGTIAHIDRVNNLLYLNQIKGTFLVDEAVQSQDYNVTSAISINTVNIPAYRMILSTDQVVPYSGEMLYASNREKITRGVNQTEHVKFVISF